MKDENAFDLEYFFDQSPDLLCIASFDGYFKKVNPAVSRTLGYTFKELYTRPIISFVHYLDKETTSTSRSKIIRKNIPLMHFENRYVTKSNETVWLSWTSMPMERDQVVFGIAKDITYRKKLEEYKRISQLVNTVGTKKTQILNGEEVTEGSKNEYSAADQAWLVEFENVVRDYTGRVGLNLTLLSYELAMSERQLSRRTHNIMGITPNHYIRVIRLQIALEAIKSGNYRTISEISRVAGFETPAYFSRIFEEVYGLKVRDLL